MKIAIVGGGIAGVLSGRILSTLGYDVCLFEKSKNLGGCAGSFTRGKFTYNIGATTVGGLYPDYPLNKIFQLTGFPVGERCPITIHHPTFSIHLKGHRLLLGPYLEENIEELAKLLNNYHREIEELCRGSFTVTRHVLTHTPYYHPNGILRRGRSFLNIFSLLAKLPLWVRMPALAYLNRLFHGRTPPLLIELLNALTLITSQCSISEVNALTLLLALGYVYTGVGSPSTGVGKLVETLADPFDYCTDCEILSLKRYEKNRKFILRSDLWGEEVFDRVILAIPILENLDILLDKDIKEYFMPFCRHQSPYSSLVMHGMVKGYKPDVWHYLLITPKRFNGLTSGNYFLSFLKVEPLKDEYTFTLSTHTPIHRWHDVKDLKTLQKIREELISCLSIILHKELGIKQNQLEDITLATPFTFKRYLNRISLGGIPVSMRSPFWRIPPNITPFPGLYYISDQSLFYQGWIGISLGALNLYNIWKDAGP